MLRVGLFLIVIVLGWSAVAPSQDSKDHPTAFLEHSAIGRAALANWTAYSTLPAELASEGSR